MASKYTDNVFLNCPFDSNYKSLRNAVVFTIYDCGFTPRCSLEHDDSGEVRFEKILRIISDSKFGIHNISRTELDEANKLPPFNMPFELGVFIGAKRYGERRQRQKNCLVLDAEPYRYQKFLSDIAGHDIRSHGRDVGRAISIVRDWLNSASGRKTIPGGKAIEKRFWKFEADLPAMCEAIPIDLQELTYNDYSNFIYEWLTK